MMQVSTSLGHDGSCGGTGPCYWKELEGVEGLFLAACDPGDQGVGQFQAEVLPL